MLERLSVSNLAIVESAEAQFGDGLNVITGETGAGKSVLMGALELALGARADASAVRDGEREARVEAEFSGVGADVDAILDEAGLPPCDGGALVLRRVIGAAGGSRVRVNDAAATVQTLRALGRALVDLHGPNDHQSLLEERFQLRVLDAYARVRAPGAPDCPQMAAYAAAWERLTSDRARLAELKGDSSDPAAEIETLRYQLAEIEALKLTGDDDEALVERHAAAAHAQEIVGHANAAVAALSGDGSACEALYAAVRELGAMARHYPAAAEWTGRAESAVTELQDLSSTVADAVSRLELDPVEFAELDERLTAVNRLKRKYAPTVAGILELAAAKSRRLADLESRDERVRELEAAVAAGAEEVRRAGVALRKVRSGAARKLARAVTAELRDLGFLQAGFGVELGEAEPSATGCDSVSFTFEPNPGEHARSLAAIASSGEIARVMLAVKTVLSAHDSIPVLVFDEIDSNIGGEVGRAVGGKLRAVAAHHQVIAITHLPQSAVFGDRHLKVEKEVSGGRTRTRVRGLGAEERVAEVARMLGGAKITSVVETHARELLEGAAR